MFESVDIKSDMLRRMEIVLYVYVGDPDKNSMSNIGTDQLQTFSIFKSF